MKNKKPACRQASKNQIIPQMFDVKPVNKEGNLDLEKIKKIEKVFKVPYRETRAPVLQNSGMVFSDIKKPDAIDDELRRFQRLVEEERELEKNCQPEKVMVDYEIVPEFRIPTRNLAPKKPEPVVDKLPVENIITENKKEERVPVDLEMHYAPSKSGFISAKTVEFKKDYFDEIEEEHSASQKTEIKKKKKNKNKKSFLKSVRLVKKTKTFFAAIGKFILAPFRFFRDLGRFSTSDYSEGLLHKKRFAFSFATMACILFLLIFGVGFVKRGLIIKGLVTDTGQNAYADLAQAKDDIMSKDFQASEFKFNSAYDRFDEISKQLDSLGPILVDASRYIPYASKLSSGAHLAQAGKDVSKIGVLAGQLMQILNNFKNPLADSQADTSADKQVSLLKIFQDTNNNAQQIQTLLTDAKNNLDYVNTDDIPEAQRAQFSQLKNQLPEIDKFLTGFVSNSQIFTDVLGGNGPRKYLFLFQNNQEMRPTGGFIGTYGVMNIFNGRIDKFFVDGIFNPDGQLAEKVVPPAPIQKISAAWSLHDSNWFPNFPTSAEKAMWFYEKTGGPTVDGVITMTPAVMQKLLEVTGPIEMSDYNITIDKDNFLEKVQQEVEVDYDKELNQPKKILADLAPKILDRIFNTKNVADIAKTMNILTESLGEKQLLIYSSNYDIEKKLSELGWSGEILNTQKDYLSVINTNINGYKTDGVIDEKIEHQAEIQPDGSVVDTVTITRHHNGGNLEYDWFNKVNADYMRVYVPKGSQLLSAEGQTREFDSPPLDYNALNFKRDAQVQMEEDSIKIDEANGTRIYDDSEKTVFANWVYVSPQETVTVKYKYLLPFKVDLSGKNNPVDTYSLLAQKQSGSVGSQFSSEIVYPDSYKVNWKYPDGLVQDSNNLKIETGLKTDKFIGIAFTK